jgi:hypothetical protein
MPTVNREVISKHEKRFRSNILRLPASSADTHTHTEPDTDNLGLFPCFLFKREAEQPDAAMDTVVGYSREIWVLNQRPNS